MNTIFRWWRMLRCPSQAYFWTKTWQEGMAASQADIDAGRVELWDAESTDTPDGRCEA